MVQTSVIDDPFLIEYESTDGQLTRTKNGLNPDSFLTTAERTTQPPVIMPNGAVYTGEWRNGERDGKGIQDWPDGSRYVG